MSESEHGSRKEVSSAPARSLIWFHCGATTRPLSVRGDNQVDVAALEKAFHSSPVAIVHGGVPVIVDAEPNGLSREHFDSDEGTEANPIEIQIENAQPAAGILFFSSYTPIFDPCSFYLPSLFVLNFQRSLL